MVAGETGAQIAAAVAALPEDQRAAVLLAEYEGLPHAAIAAVMKTSVKSVELRLYRARKFLRLRLKDLL
jgi:RNA polymerase sigma-70 factor (ECF subfamily)